MVIDIGGFRYCCILLSMRLNKYIAAAGICSRRKADELTVQGRVKINGKTVSTPGYDVGDKDTVEVDGHMLYPETKKIYIALNKPAGYITSLKDEKGRPTVMDLLEDVESRVFPVGRLDFDTTGLLILTNDGDFSYKVAHPGHEILKTYRVCVEGVLSKERLAKLRKGVDLGDFVSSPAFVELIKQNHGNAITDIKIHEGKNRQIRKMFAAVGNKVKTLERTAIGNIKLGGLKPGHYRKLKREEIRELLE